MITPRVALSLALALGLPVSALLKPSVGDTWDYPLGYTLTADNADPNTKFYGVDLVNSNKDDISALTGAGHYIVCYFSAGSRESYRDDASQFPAEAVGKVMEGWEDENWVDTRNQKVRDIMVARIALAQEKGCDGVDADNIDGYGNDTGFNLTKDDGVNYIEYLAKAAHDKDLAFGLKNGGDIAGRVIDSVEWEINEQCVQFGECAPFDAFIEKGKPVFHVEYTQDDNATDVSADELTKDCAAGKGFSTIVKHLSLDQFVKRCDGDETTEEPAEDAGDDDEDES